MIKILPKKITGKWTDGFALDFHTVSSKYIGEDEYGRAQYDTKRTELGELLYRLKYGRDQSVIEMIVSTAVDFLRSNVWSIDLVIPVPPSHNRSFQPVIAIAELLATAIGKPFSNSSVIKVKDIPELKNIYDFDERMKLLTGAFRVTIHEVKGKNVLLIDDLIRSGATMNAICSELTLAGSTNIYTLALTKTRSNR